MEQSIGFIYFKVSRFLLLTIVASRRHKRGAIASSGWLTGWWRAMMGRPRTKPCACPKRLNRLYLDLLVEYRRFSLGQQHAMMRRPQTRHCAFPTRLNRLHPALSAEYRRFSLGQQCAIMGRSRTKPRARPNRLNPLHPALLAKYRQFSLDQQCDNGAAADEALCSSQ